jgi:hypothetical protein
VSVMIKSGAEGGRMCSPQCARLTLNPHFVAPRRRVVVAQCSQISAITVHSSIFVTQPIGVRRRASVGIRPLFWASRTVPNWPDPIHD